MATKTTSQLSAVASANVHGSVLWGDDSAGVTKKFTVATTTSAADSIAARDGSGALYFGTNGRLELAGDASSPRIQSYASKTLYINELGNPVNVGGLVITIASATTSAGLRLPHGAAPTSPTNGDFWTTTAGAFIRINGVTKTFTLT